MSSEDLLDHGRRIAELELQVAELYRRIGQEPLSGFRDDRFGGGFSDQGPAADPRLLELVQAGKTIQAIKLYRELTGVGLKEAKDAVDAMST
jgi:ribosomal protein L7/L12